MEINRLLLNQDSLVLPRKVIPVPELRLLFKDLPADETPTLTIRGLTANVLFLAQEAFNGNTLRRQLVKALQEAPDDVRAADAVAKLLAEKEPESDELRRRLVIFHYGVVNDDNSPMFNELETARIAELWSNRFATISGEIILLNQEGPHVGES